MISQLQANTIAIENILSTINSLPDINEERLLTLNVSSNLASGDIVATNGSDTATGTLVNGEAKLVVPSGGIWTVNATSGERIADVSTGEIKSNQTVELDIFTATVGCHVGDTEMTVTCTNGKQTYTSTGTGIISFTVHDRGVWTISTTVDGTSWEYTPDVQIWNGVYLDVAGLNVSATLNDNTWDVVSHVSNLGMAANYWSVGDTKQITINGTVATTTFSNVSIWAFILGFDHNSDLEGNNTIHFQIGKSAQVGGRNICLVDSKYGKNDLSGYASGFAMHPDSYAQIWSTCRMRKTLLNSQLRAALPSDLRNVMRGVRKYTDRHGSIESTTDYLWLLAEFEVFGVRSCAHPIEQNYQKQYDYYINGNSKYFYQHNATSSVARWWLRSPSKDTYAFFCTVNGGASKDVSHSHSFGIAPAFCV